MFSRALTLKKELYVRIANNGFLVSDYVVAVEYRSRALKKHKVHLVSRLISTSKSRIDVKFDVLLNINISNFEFLVTLERVPRTKQVIFYRYVPRFPSKFTPRWENVQLIVDLPGNKTAFLLFDAIIPSGSKGFYVAVDNIQVQAAESTEGPGIVFYSFNFTGFLLR